MRQLRQRINFRYHLGPLTESQVGDYIRHRLRIAGPLAKAAFTDRAVEIIHRYSGGIPRVVNLTCDKALLVAFTEDSHRIDHKVVTSGIREIEGPHWVLPSRAESAAASAGAPRRTFLRLPFFGGRTH